MKEDIFANFFYDQFKICIACGELHKFENFAELVGYTGLREKFNKYSGNKWSPNEFIEIWKDVSLMLILSNQGGNRYYVYDFVDPELGVEIFFKKQSNRKMGHWFWNRGLRQLCTLVY